MKQNYTSTHKTKFGKIWRVLTLTLLSVSMHTMNAQYCSPLYGNPCSSDDYITYFNLGALTNSSGCSASNWGDYTAIPSPTLFIGQSYQVTVGAKYGNAGVAFWIDYNDDFIFDATEKVGYTASRIGANSTGIGNISISNSANAGPHRLRARMVYGDDGINLDPCANYSYGEVEDYQIVLTTLTPCAGTPGAGNATSTSTAVCANTSFDLSLANNTYADGIQYQWQSSPDGTTWTNFGSSQLNIPTPVTVNSITNTTYYQCVVTCTASAQSATSTPVMVNATPFLNCYCMPVYSWNCNGDRFTNFSIANVVAQGSNCDANGFSDSTTSNYTAINLTAGNTYTLLTNTINSGAFSGAANMGAWIDYDKNGVFDSNEYISLGYGGTGTYSNTLTVPLLSQTGTVRMRMELASNYGAGLDPCNNNNGYYYGQIIDYKVNITAAAMCSGSPNAGNATSTKTTVCSGVPFDLSLVNNNAANLGLTYQWQSSPDGTTWTNLGSVQADTPSPLNVSSISSTTHYQCVVTCTATGQSATSTPIVVNLTPLVNCYCTPAYSWYCGGDRFADFSIANVVAQGSNCDLNGYSDSTASHYTAINLTAGNTYTLLTNTINSGAYGAATMGAWIDYDQNGIFDTYEFTSLGSGTAGTYSNTLTVPLLSRSGTVRMRMELTPNYGGSLDPCYNYNGYNYGQIVDYKVNITAAPLCSGTPNAGNAVASATAVCPSNGLSLDLSGNDLVTGVSYQWQSSPNGTTWTNLGSNQINIPYSVASQSATTYYRCVATCTNGGATGTSNPVVVNKKIMDCYCTPNSWDCSQSMFTNFSIANVVAQGSNCDANGYSDSTISNYTAINLNASNTYTLLVNSITHPSNGNAAMGAWIDFDQNAVFDANEFISLGYGTSGTYSNTFTVPLSAPTGTVRMRMKLDNYFSSSSTYIDPCTNYNGSPTGQIIDYKVNITAAPACSGAPNLGNAISSLGSVCSVDSYTLDLTGNDQVSGLTYQWQSSPDGSAWTNVGTAQINIPYTVSSQTATTHYRCVATCENGGLSGNSNPVVVNQNVPTACYCIPQSLNCSTAYVSHVIIENLSDNPTCNAGSNGYNNNTVSVSAATVSANQSYTISVDVNSQGQQCYVGAWVDYNLNGIFESSEYTYIGDAVSGTLTNTINIPFTAIGGNTRMRLKMESTYYNFNGFDPCHTTNYYGQTLDYLLNITPVTPCSGVINAGNTVAPASVCAGNSFTLNLANNDIVSGATYQWMSSSDGTTYTALGNAQTTVPFVVTSQTATTYYKCNVTCTSSGSVSSSANAIVSMNTYTACYCTPDLTHCDQGDEIQNVAFETINNASGCDGIAGYTDYTAINPAITTTIQASQSYTMAVTLGNSYGEHVSVWIDYNQDGTFDASEYTFLGNTQGSGNYVVNGTVNVPLTVTPGVTRMRVRNFSYNTLGANDACYSPVGSELRNASSRGTGFAAGETEDYLVTILPPDCSSLNYPPSYGVTGTMAVCPGQSSVLDLNPAVQTAVGITYQWKSFDGTVYVDEGTPSATSSFTASPSASTLYYCEIQCHSSIAKRSDTVLVKVNTITTSPVSASVSCNGSCDGNITVNASSSGSTLSYSWSPAVGTSDMAVALCAGSYTVNVSNTTGCVITETFTITEPTAITTSTTQTNVSCFGLSDGVATIMAAGGVAPLTYSWSPSGGNNPTVSGLAAGSYSVMVSDGNNCNKTEVFTITEPALLTATISNVVGSCLGGSNGQATVQVSGGTTGYNYSWTSGSTNPVALNLPIGTQTCTVTDANSCTVTETVAITQIAANFTVNISGSGYTCEKLEDTLKSTITGGTGPFSYGWIEYPTNNTSTNANYTYTTSIGTFSYNLAVVDNSNNCVVNSNTYTTQINPSSNLTGTVTSYPSLPVAGRVVLYKYLPYLTKFDSVAGQNIGSAGDYNFISFTSGTYIIKAIPNLGSLQVAYGDSAYSWKTARQIIHGCAVTDIQNIKVRSLPSFTATPGPGLLSGVITATTGYGQRAFAGNDDGSFFRPLGTPIGGIVVKGGRNPGGQMFSQTTTDANGNYTLSNLPLNTSGLDDEYFIVVDIPGLDTTQSYHRTLTAGNSVYTHLDFVVDSMHIIPVSDPNVSVHDLSAKEHKIKVFPNPASNYVTIQYDIQYSSLVKIELFDILGKSVKMLLPETQQSIDTYKMSWQLDDLKAGLYFIKLNINGAESTIKLSISK